MNKIITYILENYLTTFDENLVFIPCDNINLFNLKFQIPSMFCLQ